MQIKDWVEIVAIFVGPIAALWIQRLLDRGRETRRHQELLYATLMRLRGAQLTPEFVNALNLIDVVFHGKKESERTIRTRWKLMMDHFNTREDNGNQWAEKRQDLTVDLLVAIGEHLGYKFEPSHIKRQVYFPQAFSDQWEETTQIRKQLLEVLDGTGSRKIAITLFESGSQGAQHNKPH